MYTQCLTAAVLFGTGDVIAQQAIERVGNKHDVRLSSICDHPHPRVVLMMLLVVYQYAHCPNKLPCSLRGPRG